MHRHHLCGEAVESRDRPVLAGNDAIRSLAARRDGAVAGPQVIAEPGDHQPDMFEVRAERHQFIDRQRPVGDLGAHMGVLGRRHARRHQPHPRLGVVAELARTGDQADGAQRRLQFARRPAELRRDRGDAVAERRQRQSFEDEVADPAIARRLALPRLDQAVSLLLPAAAIEAQRQPVRVHQVAIGPDPTHPAHLAGTKGHRKARDQRPVVIGAATTKALGAGALAAQFLEFGRPDDVAGQPRPAIEPRQRAALARSGETQVGPRRRLRLFAEQHAVDRRSRQGAQRPPDRRPERPPHGAAHHLPRQRKRQSRHAISISARYPNPDLKIPQSHLLPRGRREARLRVSVRPSPLVGEGGRQAG